MSMSKPSVAQITKFEEFVSAAADELRGKCFRLTGLYVILCIFVVRILRQEC